MQTPSPDVSSSADSISQKFEDIYRRHYDKIANYISTLLPPKHKRRKEDLTQDVFLRVWRNVNTLLTLPHDIAVSSWLHCIAKNVVIDSQRRDKIVDWYSIEQEEMEHWLASSFSLEKQVEDRESIQHCLRAIDEKHLVPLACYAHGFREEQLVEGLSYPAAKTRLMRAKRAFREAYAQEVAS